MLPTSVPELIRHFNARKADAEQELERALSIPGFRRVQRTDRPGDAEIDITPQEVARLRERIADYALILDTLSRQ